MPASLSAALARLVKGEEHNMNKSKHEENSGFLGRAVFPRPENQRRRVSGTE